MQIWLDTIDLGLVKEAAHAGIISGVTTNPSILSRSRNVPETLRTLLDIQPGRVAVQVTGENSDAIIEEAHSIAAFSERMAVKIPLHYQGLVAMYALRREKIPLLATAIFHPKQALLAAQAGVTYIAPYFFHMGEERFDHLNAMVTILQGYPTKILVASLKTLSDLIFCATIGVAACTIKKELYLELMAEPPSMKEALQRFSTEWEAGQGGISIGRLLCN